MPRLKEVYFTYDMDETKLDDPGLDHPYQNVLPGSQVAQDESSEAPIGIRSEETEIDNIYEDVGNKYDHLSSPPLTALDIRVTTKMWLKLKQTWCVLVVLVILALGSAAAIAYLCITITALTTTIASMPATSASPKGQYSKLILLNGNDKDTSRIVEVIDLNSNRTTCQYLPDYPVSIRYSYGGLIDGETPLVCGGFDWAFDNETSSCYKFSEGRWVSTFPMNQKRGHFSGMSSSPLQNPDHKFLVIGGYPEEQANSMEVLTDSGWEQLPIKLPTSEGTSGNCMMAINETSFMLVVGKTQTALFSKETWIFNSIFSSWTASPPLQASRRYMGCGIIKKSGHSDEMILIVGGGFGAEKSVELLENISGQWRSGPALRVDVRGTQPFSPHPSGGIIAIPPNSATIYHLAHAEASWAALPQKIKAPRQWPTAFLVPDELVSCT